MWIRTERGEIGLTVAIGYSPMGPNSERYVLDGVLGGNASAELASDLTREQVDLILDWIWEAIRQGCQMYDLREAVSLARKARPAADAAPEAGRKDGDLG